VYVSVRFSAEADASLHAYLCLVSRQPPTARSAVESCRLRASDSDLVPPQSTSTHPRPTEQSTKLLRYDNQHSVEPIRYDSWV